MIALPENQFRAVRSSEPNSFFLESPAGQGTGTFLSQD